MSEHKALKITNILEAKGHYVEQIQLAYGHIRVLGVDFWCKNEKWWDPKRNKKGLGLKSYIEYLEEIGG